jgi:hypothetical protein
MSVAMEVSLLYGVGSLRALQGGLVAPSEIRDRCVHRWVASVTSIPHFIPHPSKTRKSGELGRTGPDQTGRQAEEVAAECDCSAPGRTTCDVSRSPRKPLWSLGHRGFESHLLRWLVKDGFWGPRQPGSRSHDTYHPSQIPQSHTGA